jgi:uncharacterized protein
MKSRLLHEADGLRTFAVVMDTGDDAAEELVRFARENVVTGAGITAAGTCRDVTLANFDPDEMATRTSGSTSKRKCCRC